MKAEITITINHCIDCPHHRIMSDPDPDDWFNDDDEALVCLHPECHREYSSAEERCYRGWKSVVIEGSCRPYEIPKITIPEYCPFLLAAKE